MLEAQHARVRTRARYLFASTAALLCLGSAGVVQAQDAPDAVLDELVITANKRFSTVQETPVAVTAIDGEQLERQRIQTFQDLAPLVPGARFNATKGSTAQIVLRGQFQVNDSPALEVPVGTFIDELYYGTLGSFDADFFDLEQIAVLRGPQGTTFGRNTVGGAIQVTSRRPSFDGFDAYISGTVSDVPGFETKGAVNIPLGEQLAARVAFSTHNVDGWKKNYDGAKLQDDQSFSVRASLRAQPVEDLDANLSLSWFHRDSLGPAARLFGQGSLVQTLNAQYPKRTDVYSDNHGYDRRDSGAAVLSINYASPIGSITSVTGYRALEAEFSEDIDATPIRILDPIRNRMQEWAFSQELRLASPAEQRLEYVVGVYYSFESLFKAVTQGNRGGSNPDRFLSVLTRGQDQYQIPEQRARVMTLAPFGEAEFHFTDQFSLTAGIRYTYEDKNGFTNHLGFSAFYGPPFEVDWGHSWDAWTPRLIAKYEPTDDLHFYASVAKGFKGGGWSLTSTSAAAAVIPLEPETSWSYEVGAKTRWLDDRLTANLALYQANTKNLQVRSLSNGVFTDINAGEAEVQGLEFEGRFYFTPQANIGLNYAYTDATYKEFRNCTATLLDCTGNRIPYTPKNDLTISGAWTVDAPGGGALTFSGDVQWQSKVFFTSQNLLPGGDFAEAVRRSNVKGLTNLALLYEPPSGNWDVRLWVRNLTNTSHMRNYANFFFYLLTPQEAASGLTQAGRVYYEQPRRFGVTLTARM